MWSAGCPCVLARVRLPVVVTVRAGAWRRGGAWRTGLAAFPPPGAAVPLGEGEEGGGGGGFPGLRGGRGWAPPWRVPSIPGAGGGGLGGRAGGGGLRRGSSPPFSGSPARTPVAYGRVACSPRPWPPLMASGVAPHIPPCRMLGRGCLAAPGAGRGLAGGWWVSLAGWGGGRGVVSALPLVGGSAGGPRGAGGGGSLCTGLHLCPARVGIKAGRPIVVLPPTLHRLASACRRPDAVRGVPLRAGTGLLACRGNCGSGRAAACGHAAYSSVYCGSGAPSWVPRPYRGGGVPFWPDEGSAGLPSPWTSSGCPWGGERGERGRWGGSPLLPSGPPVLLSGGCGGAA